MASAPEPDDKVAPLYHYPIVVPCDLCETKDDVNSFCRNCSQKLCDGCKRLHLRSTVSRDHNIVHISEGKSSESKATFCAEHGERLFFYCRTCSVLFCPKCLNTSHKTHDFLDTDEYAKELQSKIDMMIDEKSKKVEEGKQNTLQLEDNKQTFTEACTKCKTSVIDTAKHLHLEVDRIKNELMSDIKNYELRGLSKFDVAIHQERLIEKELQESLDTLVHHSKKHDNISLVAYASKMPIQDCKVNNGNNETRLGSVPGIEHRKPKISENEISRLLGKIKYQDSDILCRQESQQARLVGIVELRKYTLIYSTHC